MIRLQMIVTLLMISFSLVAQHTLQANIQDENGAPLMFANVLLLSETDELIKGEVTDGEGKFITKDIPSGNYTLSISAIGYDDFRQAIELTEDLNLGILTVAQSNIALKEFTVSAQKAAFVRKADRTVVNVASLPTAAGGNALELLEKSPSVRVDRVSSEVSLLGRNGVLVFLNGKRSRLDGNDLMQYLATIPASNIVSLELINNPPASYDADGTGGVINIVLKNYEADGFNGSTNLFGGYGIGAKYGGGLGFNYKSGKLNVYGDASTSQDYTAQNSEIISSIVFNDGLLATNQQSERPVYLGNYNGKLGLSYDLTKRTTLDIFGSYSRRRWEMSATTTTDYQGEISPIQNDRLTGEETNTTNQYNWSARIQHQLENGHTLSADYDYLNFNIINPTDYRLQNFKEIGSELSIEDFKTEKETPFDFHVGRLDYKGSFNEAIHFEAGIKATLSEVENNTSLRNENGTPSSNPLFTDQMDLAEQIYAAYLSVNGQLGESYSFTGGIRYEYSNLELSANQGDIDRQISRLFPSLSLTRNFSEVSRLTISYRERIARPGFQNLAPAFFFLNPYTVLTGNIQALPNINRTAELTLNHQTLFASLSYSNDGAPIVRFAVPQLNQADNLLLLISDNIENRQQIGLNIGFPIEWTRFWNSRYTIGSYWRSDEVRFGEETITESNPFLSVDIAQNFQLPKDWSMELSGRWNSRTWQGTIAQPQQTFINFGIQKKFKNSMVGLSWTDIFDTGSFLGFINDLPQQGILYDWHYDIEGSIVRLSYSYNFGGQLRQARQSGAKDVLERVNN
ncbi:MAG: TonB-dependent receptor [Bacteroidota bacterium]